MFFPLLLAAVLVLNPSAGEAQTPSAPTHAEAVQAANDGRDAEALVAFQRLASVNPADHAARLWIARLHARMGHWALAEPVYRSVLLEDPGNVDAMIGVAAALLARDEPALALEILEPARQGGLGDVHRPGRFAEAAVVRDRDEGLESERVDSHCQIMP